MARPLRILLVEDNPDDAALLERELRRVGFEPRLQRVETGEAMAAALAGAEFDLVISDYSLPRFSGPEALALFGQHALDVPFLVCSGSIGETQAVELLKAGANDFFLKDSLARLGAAIERELREAENRRARRRAEAAEADAVEALRRSEQRFRAIVDAAPGGMLLADAEGVLRLVNPALERMFGYEPGELLGERVESLVPEPLRSRHTEDRVEFALNPERRRMGAGRDLEALRKDGSTFPAEIGLSPLESAEGALVLAVVIDVTERRRAAAAAQAMEARFQALVENSSDGIALVDAEGSLIYASPAITRILGYDPRRVVGLDVLSLMHPDDLPLARRGLVRALASQDAPRPEEVRCRHADGSYRDLEVIRANRLDDNAVRAVVLNYRDVTERKEAERRKRNLEAQLLQAQKMEAVGRVAGGVAHDFNNLVGVIAGYGELAQRQLPEDHPVQVRLEQILKAAGRAAELTRQMLAFSRRQVLHPRPVDLNEAIRGARPMLERVLGEDVAFVERLEPRLGTVMVDPTQVDQVLLNLAVNARDAMPGGGTLSFETANVELDEDYVSRHAAGKAGAYVLCAVSDTGVGMDEATLSRLFEPFFTTKPEGKGTGLGLATVYGIVKQSEGFIWVYSEPGQGATFKVYLPRVDAPIPKPAAAPEPIEPARGTESILVVEDQEALRLMIQEVLEQQGYRVLAAADGPAALELVRAHEGPLDLLLTDVVMPGMNGRELADAVGALRPGIRALFMSGYSNGSISDRGLLMAGTSLIQKPFSGDALRRAVREALRS